MEVLDNLMAYSAGFVLLFVVIMIWSVIIKAIAMWRAARNSHKAWYVVMLLINTAGILEVIYLLTDGKKSSKAESKTEAPVRV